MPKDMGLSFKPRGMMLCETIAIGRQACFHALLLRRTACGMAEPGQGSEVGFFALEPNPAPRHPKWRVKGDSLRSA